MKYEYVADRIQDDYKRWHEGKSMVVLSTPTGSGKTTSVLRVFVPYAREQEKHVVWIGNRVVLQKQMERSKYEFYLKECMQEEVLYLMSYQQLEEGDDFVEKKLEIISKCSYLIVDEAHYFVTDSLFSAKAELSLKRILSFAGKIPIIFMTATPKLFRKLLDHCTTDIRKAQLNHYEEYKEILERRRQSDFKIDCCDSLSEIVEAEAKYEAEPDAVKDQYRAELPELLTFEELSIEPDYSYIDLHFFSSGRSSDGNKDVIQDLILQSSREDGKWLCFVNSVGEAKKKAEELNKAFEREWVAKIKASSDGEDNYPNMRKAACLTAEFRHNSDMNEVVEALVDNEAFPPGISVTYCTTVVYNGVNIGPSSNVNNIVFYGGFFEQELLQCIGRRRILPGEKINVYVDCCNAKTFYSQKSRYFRDYMHMKGAYLWDMNIFQLIFGTRIPWDILDRYTYEIYERDAYGKLVSTTVVSKLSYFVLSEYYKQADEIYELMKKDNYEGNSPLAYAEKVAGWLKKDISEIDIVNAPSPDERVEAVLRVLNSIGEKFFDRDAEREYANAIVVAAGGSGSTDVSTANKAINEVGLADYRIESIRAGKTTVYYLSLEGKKPVCLVSSIKSASDIVRLINESEKEMSPEEVYSLLFGVEMSPVFANTNESTSFLNICLKMQDGYEDAGSFRRNGGGKLTFNLKKSETDN